MAESLDFSAGVYTGRILKGEKPGEPSQMAPKVIGIINKWISGRASEIALD